MWHGVIKILSGLSLFGLIAGLTISLTGCGYHLRGQGFALDTNGNVQLSATANTRLVASELRRRLARAGLLLSIDQEQATSKAISNQAIDLQLINEQVKQRVAAVARDGIVQEYAIDYTLSYRLQPLASAAAGLTNVAEQNVETIQYSREYAYDRVAVQGNASQQQIITEGLRNDAVNQVLRQLQLAIQNQTKTQSHYDPGYNHQGGVED